MTYEVSKQRGSNRYYVHPAGEPNRMLPGTLSDKKQALHTAAELEGLSYKEYMDRRKKQA